MIRRPPTSTRPFTLFPFTTLCLSGSAHRTSRMPQRRRSSALLHPSRLVALVPAVLLAGALVLASAAGGSVRAGEALTPEQKKAVEETIREYLLKRSEEHTSELQSLMRSSYAVFCLKNKQEEY